MSNLDKDLQKYLDDNYPLENPGEFFQKTEKGNAMYRAQMLMLRSEATKHFVSGYLAAFKDGNMSPNSSFKVVSIHRELSEDWRL